MKKRGKKVFSYTYMYRNDDIFDGTIYRQTFTDVTNGTSNPYWRSQVKSGLNAATPYTSDRLQVHNIDTFCRAQHLIGIRQSPGGSIVGSMLVDLAGVGGSLDLSSVITEVGSYNSALAEAQALNRVYKKIRQEYESAQGLEFLGELRETIHAIRHPADAIRQAFFKMHHRFESANDIAKRLKRKRRETDKAYRTRQLKVRYKSFLGVPKIVADAVAGSRLEIEFGWKPLFGACKDLAEAAIESIVGPSVPRLKVVGTSDDFVSSFTNGDPTVGYRTYIRYRDYVSRVTTRSIRYTVGLQPRISAPLGSLEKLAERSGLGLRNFVPTLWELCPYSVFVDYFINIGDILGAACTSTSSVQWQCRTERVRTDGVMRKHSVEPSGLDSLHTSLAFTTTDTVGALQTTRTRLTRTVPATLPLPPLVLSLPGEGSGKWYNLAAFAELQSKRFSKLFQ